MSQAQPLHKAGFKTGAIWRTQPCGFDGSRRALQRKINNIGFDQTGPRMTLAGAILLFIISCTTQLFSLDWLSAQSSGPTPGTSNAAQNQTPAPTSTPPESPKPDTAAKPSTAKPRPKGTAKKSPAKKVVTSNCDTTPAAAASAPTSSSNPPTSLQDPANADAAAAPATAPVTPAQNCPPQKVI